MADLRLFDLFKNNCEDTQKDNFLEKVNSKVELKLDFDILQVNSY